MLVQYRDPSLSLWQSAIDETIRDANPGWALRPSLAGSEKGSDKAMDKAASILREVARHCAAIAEQLPLDHLLSNEPAFAKLLALPPTNKVKEQLS